MTESNGAEHKNKRLELHEYLSHAIINILPSVKAIKNLLRQDPLQMHVTGSAMSRYQIEYFQNECLLNLC